MRFIYLIIVCFVPVKPKPRQIKPAPVKRGTPPGAPFGTPGICLIVRRRRQYYLTGLAIHPYTLRADKRQKRLRQRLTVNH
jgi:hypothetical protein